MRAHSRLGVKELAVALNRSEGDIRALVREAVAGQKGVEWPVLRDRTTGAPLTDSEGLAYAVVQQIADGARGRPPTGMGLTFRAVKSPQERITPAQRYLLSGCVLSKNHQSITAIAAEAGIVPGAPVRAWGRNTPGASTQVIAAKEPGPVLGMLLRPEGAAEGWQPRMGDRLDVLVQGTLLLPSAGPIGMGAVDRLLWDPEAFCWRGEPLEDRPLLELRGSWGLGHCSEDGELAAALIDGDVGLRLE